MAKARGTPALLQKKSAFKIEEFKELIEAIKSGSKEEKIEKIKELLEYEPLINHHCEKEFRILAECDQLEYPHELHTCKKLLKEGYHVIFVPKGYFKRDEKKFDIFLFKRHLLFEADLKCITSNNPDTIAKRIKDGSQQAHRLVLDIHSIINKNTLIDGLQSGCKRNNDLFEIMLFYNSAFYRLPKAQILGKNIFKVIK